MTDPYEATDILFRRVKPIACVSCVAWVLACEVIDGDENHRDPQIAFGMSDDHDNKSSHRTRNDRNQDLSDFRGTKALFGSSNNGNHG